MAKRSNSVARVEAAARALGLPIEVVEMPASTRTAAEAAAACGCDPDQIVKSLIFETEAGGLALLLIAGGEQANLDAAADVVGARLRRADPRRVREETGFAIGGVAPIGHLAPVPVWHSRRLLAFDRVWAAAGAPNAVFAVDPAALIAAIGAKPL